MICRRREKGFTLIELMIVIAIIGILVAIAIPQFAAYRIRGFNATAMSDLRHMMTAQEAYFTDHMVYVASGAEATNLSAYGYTRSTNVTATILSSNSFSYQMTTKHLSGDRIWTIIGPSGQIQ
ncbi:MAG: tfp pilus assembly protein, major pilin [Deltaproteobacteria bacterium]|nr:tfp pilus assembly protein, major pilin [Deltaproteobacteria bacterium]